eukprot:1139201-Pelagomonas_calceolata.AAC.4
MARVDMSITSELPVDPDVLKCARIRCQLEWMCWATRSKPGQKQAAAELELELLIRTNCALAFSIKRGGFIYGTVDESMNVKVCAVMLKTSMKSMCGSCVFCFRVETGKCFFNVGTLSLCMSPPKTAPPCTSHCTGVRGACMLQGAAIGNQGTIGHALPHSRSGQFFVCAPPCVSCSRANMLEKMA